MNIIAKAVYGMKSVDNDLYDFLYKNCSEYRKKRASRFYKREDACRSLVAEYLLIHSLKELGITEKVNVCIDPKTEKPYLENLPLHFNLTHSGNWVGCVVDNNETGIDIEKVKNVRNGLADRFFSEMEKKMLNECSCKESSDDLFFKMWVLKESYIKAIGKGLSCPLSSFSVLPHDNNNVELLLHDQTLPEKYFRLYDISADYRCAVCTTNNQLPRDVEILSVEEMAAG